MPILLVEDDRDLAAGLREALRSEGLAVNHVATGKAAIDAIAAEMPGVVVLDIGLPDIDGLSVLRRLRAEYPDLPVLLLTARASVTDKVAGLDTGADDYLAKPFDMEELLARIRVLRRRNSAATSSEIIVGALRLDTKHHEAWYGDEPLVLSRREYMLLKALVENAGRVQTREMLERKLYSWGEEIASNALEVHIHNLRKRISPDFIKTVRGVGYVVART